MDSTLSFLREGYTFISNRCDRLHTDIFESRLMLERVFCMRGEEAARMFYAPERFTRRGAVPVSALLLLQDLRSVQLLDGAAHRHRKQMFTSLLMNKDHVAHLVQLASEEWRLREMAWRDGRQVALYDEACQVLCRAVCAWAGVPLAEGAAAQRALEFAAMVDGSGRIGPQNWRAQVLRLRTEQWIQGIIGDIRAARLPVQPGSAAHAIAWHHDDGDALLDGTTAAVELINILRPVVAVARFITFAALALHDYPASRRQVQHGGEEYLEWFAQEVRRFYPFFPAIGGRVRTPFEWREHHFTKGTWVLLDLYGTNHDPSLWGDPFVFRPTRFRDKDVNAFNLIPQGGGAHADSHRCPGEDIAVALTKAAVRHLATLDYDVPPQDLHIDLSTIPALPASGFVIANVRSPAR